jgi:hypothetical protein
MGTTLDALASPESRCCYVLAIEGYPKLLTDHYNMAAVVTAWAASSWTACLPGLKVGGVIKRSVEPWQTDIGAPTIQIAVMPDDNDTFGKAVFNVKPTFVTRMTETFRPAVDGSGVIYVKSTAGAFASGDVYIGGRKYSYDSKSAGSFTVGLAGSNTHSPFSADTGNHYAGPATHPENVNFDVGPSPRVSNAPRKWIGRKCALYIHRISGDTLDVLAQAHLEFAGRIRGVDDDEDGNTLLDIEDMAASIRDCVILKDQWTGYVKPGIRLVAGTRFHVYEENHENTSAEFIVVASGASGDYEMDEGLYDLDDFTSRLNSWLAAETDTAVLDAQWNVGVKQSSESGLRMQIAAIFPTPVPNVGKVHFHCTSRHVLDFMGFTQPLMFNDDGTNWLYVVSQPVSSTVSQAVGDVSPYKAKFLQDPVRADYGLDQIVELDASDGVFFDQSSYLPPGLRGRVPAGDVAGVFQVGNITFLASRDSATQLSHPVSAFGIAPFNTLSAVADNSDGLRMDADEEKLAVRQILILSGSFTDVATKLVASLGGTSGVNHADYDVFPWGAGIPWSLLGDDWLNSCRSAEQAMNSKSIMALVTKPTKLLDLLIPEFAMRLLWLVWKDEGYQLRTLPTPNSLTADHVLDETNKAEPVGTSTAGRATTHITDEYLTNVIKLEYARKNTGEYTKTLEVRDNASIAEHGVSQAKTIQAANSFTGQDTGGASVEEMAAALVTRVFPVFGKPLHIMRRTIAPTVDASPLDTVSVSDDYARDPTSGVRGIEGRAGIILSVARDRGANGGKMFGEVEILFADEDRHYPMAPAAEIDTTFSGALNGRTFTNGYAPTAAGGPAIKLKSHAYSRSSDTADVNRFAATDLLRIVRLDDSSGDAWSRTLSTVVAADSVLVLSADLTVPAYTSSATERYRVQYREYSACTASQKLHAFQADDADGMIEDVAEPNTYGEQQWQRFGTAAVSGKVILPTAAEYWGDGMPVHPGLLHDLSLFNNNLPNYRTAPNCPVIVNSVLSTVANEYTVMGIFPLYLGAPAAAGLVRKLRLAPFMRIASAPETGYVRVSSSSLPPKAGSAGTTVLFQGPYSSVEFTSTGTSFAEAAEQSLIPVRSGNMTWLTIEMKTSTTPTLAHCYGLSRCYLGPAEVF